MPQVIQRPVAPVCQKFNLRARIGCAVEVSSGSLPTQGPWPYLSAYAPHMVRGKDAQQNVQPVPGQSPNAITIVVTLVGNAWWKVTAPIDILPAVRGRHPPLPERALPLPLGTGQQTRPRAPFAHVLSYADSSLCVNALVEPEVIASSIVRLHNEGLHRKVFPRC
jgi:hypothetical protein